MKRRLGLLVTIVVISGCTSWQPFTREDPAPLSEADALAARGEYAAALAAYDAFLRRHPEDGAASRVRGARAALAALVTTQDEVARLRREMATRQAEVGRLKRELDARDTELLHARQELGARQAEVQRLALEAERLRSDLEDLKRIEMRLERVR